MWRGSGHADRVAPLLVRVGELRGRCDAMTTPAVRAALRTANLTLRESEVVAMRAAGTTTGDIAGVLGLQPATVRHLAASARTKLGVEPK